MTYPVMAHAGEILDHLAAVQPHLTAHASSIICSAKQLASRSAQTSRSSGHNDVDPPLVYPRPFISPVAIYASKASQHGLWHIQYQIEFAITEHAGLALKCVAAGYILGLKRHRER